MRFIILVKATQHSEAGVMPSTEELTAMGNYNEQLVKAGIMVAGEGLHPSSKGTRVRFSAGKPTTVDGNGGLWRRRYAGASRPGRSPARPGREEVAARRLAVPRFVSALASLQLVGPLGELAVRGAGWSARVLGPWLRCRRPLRAARRAHAASPWVASPPLLPAAPSPRWLRWQPVPSVRAAHSIHMRCLASVFIPPAPKHTPCKGQGAA
jgi:hypothetical protein